MHFQFGPSVMRVILLFCAALVLPMIAQAADIRLVDARTMTSEEIEDGGCSLRLTGPIVSGDAERLRSLIDTHFPLAHDELNPALCLDSPGGSLDEGVRIAELLGERFTATVVPAGAECLSACAVAFMGGTFGWYEYIFNMRVMHPTARVGFHAPGLTISDGAYDGASVMRAFDVAVDAIARIAGDLDETYLTGVTNRFPRSLLAGMLVHRGEDYLWINTVEKAGAWDVWLITDQRPQLDGTALTRVCKAVARWLNDSPKMEFAPQDWELAGDFTSVEGADGQWTLRYGELFEVVCQIERRDNGILSVRVVRDESDLGQIYLRPWMAFAADTALVSLR